MVDGFAIRSGPLAKIARWQIFAIIIKRNNRITIPRFSHTATNGGIFMAKTEEKILQELCRMEDLAEKRTKIYSRLLTDTDKAQGMEILSTQHKAARERIEILLYGKPQKRKKEGAGTR